MDAALELDHPVLFICYIIFFNKIRTYHRYLFIFSRVISQIYQGYTVYTRGYLKIYRHAVKKNTTYISSERPYTSKIRSDGLKGRVWRFSKKKTIDWFSYNHPANNTWKDCYSYMAKTKSTQENIWVALSNQKFSKTCYSIKCFWQNLLIWYKWRREWEATSTPTFFQNNIVEI